MRVRAESLCVVVEQSHTMFSPLPDELNIIQYSVDKQIILLCEVAPGAAEGCSRCVDVEAMLQHAGGQLCPQQSAACGLLTESGKNVFSATHSLHATKITVNHLCVLILFPSFRRSCLELYRSPP